MSGSRDYFGKGEYQKDAEQGIKVFKWTFWKVVGVVIGIVVLMTLIGFGLGWFGNAAKVAQEQFSPEALLAKYEWFKDASAQLDKKIADVGVYDGRVKGMEETYKDVPRIQWPREDREQMSIWQSEVAGVKASYNALAAEYNASMAKFNWRFANVGDLPKGADRVLPREYRLYLTE